MQVNPDDVRHDPDKFKLDDALMDVLVHNKDEFVLLFIECGVNLKNFIKTRLYDLYDQVCLIESIELRFESHSTQHKLFWRRFSRQFFG